MDTPYTLQHRTRMHPHISRAIGIVLIIVLIALAACAAYWYYHARQQTNSGSNSLTNARITLSADTFPVHSALLLDLSHEALIADHIANQGTKNIYAEALTKNAGYYLISGPAAGQSTLYKLDLRNPRVGLQQLSTSTSDKVGLSVNDPAGMAAFTVGAKGTTTHVIALDLRSEKETDLGAGTDPTVLADGLSVLFERGDSLVSAEISTGKTHQLATTTSGAPFAVDTYRSQLAVYDPTKNIVRLYVIGNDGSVANEASSVTPKSHPDLLFYYGDTLFMVHKEPSELVLSHLDGSSAATIAAAGFSLDGFTIHAL